MLYKLYQAEKYNRKVIEDEDGFISYNVYDDGSLYIETLFVRAEARNKGKGSELEQRVIEKEKPSLLICDIDLKSSNPEITLVQFIRKAKYKILRVEEDKIVLYKNLSYE